MRDYGNTQSPRYDLVDHRRRMQHTVQVGRVMEVDYKASKVRVRIGDKDEDDKIETDWVPWQVPRSSNNRVWDAPEVDEQVTLIAPSGHLNNAFALRGVPYDTFQNEAQSPDVVKQTWRTKPDDKKLDAMVKFNRKTGKYYHRIKKSGQLHLQVGPEAAIVITDEEIQIKNKDTMISMTKEGIKMFVKKEECTLCMVPDSITAQVKQKGIWKLTEELFTAAIETSSYLKITKDTITTALKDAQVGIQMAASKLEAMVGTSILSIQQATAKLFAGASAIVTDTGGVLITSPSLQGLMGQGVPGNYNVSEYDKPDKDEEPEAIKEPPSDSGYKPYRPAKSSGTDQGTGA